LNLPQPHIPQINLPGIRLPIHLPFVGCPGADARSYIGEQFGNLPDLVDAFHAKHLRKLLNDQIFALLKGQLPTILRKFFYLQKALELIQQIAEIVAVLNQVIGQAIAEYNATIAFINEKQAELNQGIAEIESIPASSRTAVHQLTLQRYNEYLGELDAQATRLQTSITCMFE
jgi:hypothetical protein